MFDKLFDVQIDGFDVRTRIPKGRRTPLKICRAYLRFQFDKILAERLGGPALSVFEAMSTDCETGQIGPVPLSLNATATNVRFQVGHRELVIDDTIGLEARVVPPTAKSPAATLQAKVSFVATDTDIAALFAMLDSDITVQMDRKQLEFPGMTDTPPTADFSGESLSDLPGVAGVLSS